MKGESVSSIWYDTPIHIALFIIEKPIRYTHY